jgi:hypothetical protein
MRRLIAAAFGVLIAATPAAAQEKPYDIFFGFGSVFPTTAIKNDFDAGWNGTIGGTFYFKPTLGFQAAYMYDHMNGPDKQILVSATPIAAALTNGVIESNHQMHVGTFNLVARSVSDRLINGYFSGGGGVYHRIVQLTSPTVGYTSVCDPYWYVCYPAAVSVDQIIGDRSSTDFGINIGGGVTFGREAKFYIESHYHYVWGKTINPVTAQPVSGGASIPTNMSTSAGYFPIVFGLRF